ncbi:hypothetical protein D3C87_2003510 [compost metagenome]
MQSRAHISGSGVFRETAVPVFDGEYLLIVGRVMRMNIQKHRCRAVHSNGLTAYIRFLADISWESMCVLPL